MTATTAQYVRPAMFDLNQDNLYRRIKRLQHQFELANRDGRWEGAEQLGAALVILRSWYAEAEAKS